MVITNIYTTVSGNFWGVLFTTKLGFAESEISTYVAIRSIVNDNVVTAKGLDHPVTRIAWYDVVKWCNARSQMEGLTPCYYTAPGFYVVYKTGQIEPYVKWNAKGYPLPTEAEWEKAARGGTPGHRFPWSHTDYTTHALANYKSSSSYPYDHASEWGVHPQY